jgi:putative ABC transport system permease protein
MFESFLQDIRIGLRVLIKEKGFCALAVVVLALGIGAVTTQFSIVNGVVLRGFAFPNADRLMSIQFIDPAPAQTNNFFGTPNQILSLDYQELAANQKSFEMIAGYIFQSTVNLTHNNQPERYTGAYVTEHFFKILGVAPVLGRDFAPSDNVPGAEKVTLLSDKIWRRDFGADPKVIGTAVRINGKPATVIGVMPPRFAFPISEELWIPYFNEFPPRPRNERNASGAQPSVLGLLRRDVPMDQAAAEMSTFASRLAKDFADTNKQFTQGRVQPLIKTFTPAQIQGLMFAMLLVCVAVLMLACANVMNMQFARATLRAKELAVRSSLGATRGRLIRQMLTESLLLATLGATLGVALAYYATDLLQATVRNLSVPVPSHISFEIDGLVLVAVVLATMFSAIISGVLPAWMASRTNPVEVLKESGRGNTSRAVTFVTRGLVILQILLTCIVLIASLLQLQSILRQQDVEYGYDTKSLMSARMGLMDGDYPTPNARMIFKERLVRELRASGEFEQVALSSRTRMAFAGNAPIEIEGREYKENRDRPTVNFEQISDGYFATLGMKLLAGRDFNSDDIDTKQPVVIINAGFAKKQFGNDNPIGRRIRTVINNGQAFSAWRTIIGVVSDVRMLGPFNNPQTEEYGFYAPITASIFGPARPPAGPQFSTILVKPRVGPGADVAPFGTNLRRAVNKVDPNLPLYFIGTPKEQMATFLGTNRIIAMMFSIFGAVAMVLAAVGLYGVMSFSVNQRTQEFGIRMALGAENRSILGMVLRQGALQLAIGLVCGIGVALVIARVGAQGIRQQLNFNIEPTDLATYAAVAGLLTLVSLIATFVPALRATRVDPMTALRNE